MAKFISFEGVEGAGKTTAIDGLCAYFDHRRLPYVRTREPGGTPFAEMLRNYLLNPSTTADSQTEMLTLFAARADHLYQVIMPTLADNKWVICDRFIDSTVAYQGFGRYGGDPDALRKIDLLISNFVTKLPDITFWLDLPPEMGRQRATKRGTLDRFERQDEDFFARVLQGFDHQANRHARIKKIDANQPPCAVLDDIICTLFCDV